MDLPEPRPVDEQRRAKLMLAAALVLQKSDVTPLERSWATEVLDLCAALGEERGGWGP
jgi:hypothetical protein